jgi:hypothetical protein
MAQGQAPLTNQDLIELHKAGFSPGLIVSKINSSPTNFDASVSALQELKKAGVSETAIMAAIHVESAKLSRSRVQSGAASPGRTRWEYRFEYGPSEKSANEIGAEGWEFVAVHAAVPGAANKAPMYVFKRARQ